MKLKFALPGFIALGVASIMPMTSAMAQAPGDSALLNALVKKGVLSNAEAKDIETQDLKEYNATAASKITLASSIKSITFYGDLRLRYELRDGETGAGATGTGGALANKGDTQDRNAWRYRLRFGIKGQLTDNFFFGIRAATNPYYNRSGNVNFGASDSAGPFGKARNLLALDQVYLGFKPSDDFTLTGGQMPQPLYTTSMIWSDDINPTGASEQYDHTFGNAEVFATAAQFAYSAAAGNDITNGLGNNSGQNSVFMFAEQVGIKYKINDNLSFKGAATMYTYSGTKSTNPTTVASLYSSNALVLNSSGSNSPAFFNGPFVGAAAPFTSNVSGINDLAVLETPFEFDFKIGPGVHKSVSHDPKDMKSVMTETTGWSLPVRVFGDFAYNFEAKERADQARASIESLGATAGNSGVTGPAFGAGTPFATQAAANAALVNTPEFQGVLSSGKSFLDQSAYQVGIEVGQTKKKGDWDGKLLWQSTGYYAVDPNLIDADIFNAATNMQGVVVALSHNWTDGIISTFRYAHGFPVNGLLATPNVTQDLTEGDIKQYNLFQADLMWKF